MTFKEKIKKLTRDWGYIIMFCLLVILLFFALGDCIYAAIVNPFTGWCGIIGVTLAILAILAWLYEEIRLKFKK